MSLKKQSTNGRRLERNSNADRTPQSKVEVPNPIRILHRYARPLTWGIVPYRTVDNTFR